ncbi:MAG: hypothetical protein ABSE74_04150, partial [Methanoregula sp.]
MRGKRTDTARIRDAVTLFLKGERHLVFGFEEAGETVRHRIYRKEARSLSLFNPYFDVNGAVYLRRLFSKDAKVLVMLRPCEIRAYVELSKLTQVER